MAARLKVFGWSDGFHSWTVATTSRPKALAAWNMEQDVFKSGLAHEIEAGPERDAALAAPGTVIKTGLAIDPGRIEATKPRNDAGEARRRKARARVAEIEFQIETLKAEAETDIEALEQQRQAIDDRIETRRAALDKAVMALKKKRAAADTAR